MKTRIIHIFSMMLIMLTAASCGGGSSNNNTSANANGSSSTTQPTITIQGKNPVAVTQGTTYIDLGAAATSSNGSVLNVTSTGLVDTDTVGRYIVTYSATDSAGHTLTTNRVVNVTISNGVIVTIAGQSTINIAKNSIFTDLGATAISNTDGAINVTTTGLVDTSTAGLYTIRYSATDSTGQKTTVTRTVNVAADNGDATLPILTIIGNNPFSVDQNSPYIDAGATATDNVDNNLFISSTANAVNVTVIGTYYVNYYTTDTAGNSTTVIRTVVVRDAIAPVITLIGSNPDIVIQNTEYLDAGATAVDNNDPIVNVTTTGLVDTTTIGSYTLTYSSTDATGNSASITRTINVIEQGIVGAVTDYSQATGLVGTEISSNNQTVTSGFEGRFTIPVSDNFNSRRVVNFSKAGYAPTSKIVLAVTEATNILTVNADMLPIALTDHYNPTQNFTVEVTGTPAKLTISANTLIGNEGNLPSTNIIANVTPIDPALGIDLIPGDMTTSSGAQMSSFGAISIELVNPEGESIDLATGETATVKIPASNKTASALPNTAPLFYYDFTQGYWVEEGTATLVNNSYYQATINHLGTWNVGILYETISINGCVEQDNSARVANALVKADGFNYSGTMSALTDSNGRFTIDVKKNSRTLLLASTPNRVSNTIMVGGSQSTSSDIDMVDCLRLGEDQITVRLTWGQNPSDLDTHLIGPNGFHIYYVNRGSLDAPPFIQLDVDDTTSYGPEVLTMLGFPDPGTYHYAIYHFAGSSSISASPARVELTIAGRRTVFTPPPRQRNNKWWNVFDIIVDENGDKSITPVNSWGSSEPASDR